MGDTVSAEEFRKEKEKLEKDRAMLNERLTALNLDREQTISKLAMVAGAIQTVDHFLAIVDPEVNLEDEIDMSDTYPDELQGPGPDEDK